MVKDGLIINHLKKLIKKSPYFGRLTYLLNEDESKVILLAYLRKIIKVIRMIDKNDAISPYQISKETSIKRDAVQEIIDEINKKKNKLDLDF